MNPFLLNIFLIFLILFVRKYLVMETFQKFEIDKKNNSFY